MDNQSCKSLFCEAARFDHTISPGRTTESNLTGRRLQPIGFNRVTLFENMSRGKVSVFKDFPSPLRTKNLRDSINKTDIVLNSLLECDIDQKIRVKTGRAKTEKYLSIEQLVEKWRLSRAIINVTDFHFRNTRIERTIDPKRLSQFNLYPACGDAAADLEMMTLVMSTVGGFSDSHSDDSDGSNHCFVGKKLWLAWDTYEGLKAGLQDVDRVDVYSQCKFNMKTWLSLKSAQWFTVEDGQTLFMPGHLTHKVVTLKPYLGVGSFYLALPNFLRTISRWLARGANWELLEADGFRNDLYPDVFNSVTRKILSIRKASTAYQERWGYDFLPKARKQWHKEFARDRRTKFMRDPALPETSNQIFNNQFMV